MVLREQIMRGLYQPKSILPKEDDLCVFFGVSRITVRRALADLKEQGLVERLQGRGTFVSSKLPGAHPFESMNFVEALKKRGQETQVKVLSVEIKQPPGTVALQLQLSSGAQAVYCGRLRHIGKMPLMVTEAWVPLMFGKDVTATQLKKRPLYDILLAQGIVFGRVIEEITAVSADPNYANLLRTGVGMPLLRVTRLVYGTDKKPVQHLTIHLSPERSRILLNVPPRELQHMVSSRITHDLVMS